MQGAFFDKCGVVALGELLFSCCAWGVALGLLLLGSCSWVVAGCKPALHSLKGDFFSEDAEVDGSVVNFTEGFAEDLGSGGFAVDEPNLLFRAGHGLEVIE